MTWSIRIFETSQFWFFFFCSVCQISDCFRIFELNSNVSGCDDHRQFVSLRMIFYWRRMGENKIGIMRGGRISFIRFFVYTKEWEEGGHCAIVWYSNGKALKRPIYLQEEHICIKKAFIEVAVKRMHSVTHSNSPSTSHLGLFFHENM